MRAVLIAAMSLALLVAPATATAIMDTQQFLQYLSGVADRLQMVWATTIRPVADHVRGQEGKSSELQLHWARRCRIIPEYDRDHRTIQLDRVEFPALLSYLQQVTLVYVLGLAEVASPDNIDAYVQQRLRPFIQKRLDECGTSEPAEADVTKVEALNYFASPDYVGRPYGAVMQQAQSMPNAATLADLIAAYPTFFEILHETGHHVLHRDRVVEQQRREREADGFAVQVFHDGGGSITLGVPFLQLLALTANQHEIACRIKAVAEAETDADIAKALSGFPDGYVHRVRALREFYLQRYRAACI